jgi:hypothetical protein
MVSCTGKPNKATGSISSQPISSKSVSVRLVAIGYMFFITSAVSIVPIGGRIAGRPIVRRIALRRLRAIICLIDSLMFVTFLYAYIVAKDGIASTILCVDVFEFIDTRTASERAENDRTSAAGVNGRNEQGRMVRDNRTSNGSFYRYRVFRK